MTKAWSCVGEEQFHAYPILDELRKAKDYVNQFGKEFRKFSTLFIMVQHLLISRRLVEDGDFYGCRELTSEARNRLHRRLLDSSIRSLHADRRDNACSS